MPHHPPGGDRRCVTSDNDPFDRTLAEHYPESIPQADFVEASAELLSRYGFERSSTLAGIAACRDELAGSLVHDVESAWGPGFNLMALAGMLTAGRTGISAAADHAPVEGGRRRLVLFAMPHIAISERGVVGEIVRPGVPVPSPACGALSALRRTLAEERAAPAFDRFDAEQTLLAERLSSAATVDRRTSLVELTELAAAAIAEDALALFDHVRGRDRSVDGAILTGVQIHGPGGRDFVAPRASYLLLDGDVQPIDHLAPEPRAASAPRRPRLRKWMARGAVASTVIVLVGGRRPVSPRVGL